MQSARRPWWTSNLAWLAISAAIFLIGLFVFRGFFLFLPLVWIGGGASRRRSRVSSGDEIERR